MIKRIPEYARPKVWRPREDYRLPEDGISMSVASAYPNAACGTSEIAIYRDDPDESKREDDRTSAPTKVTVVDAKCNR